MIARTCWIRIASFDCSVVMNFPNFTAGMGNNTSSPLQEAAAHDDIDKVHSLIAQSRIELNGTDKVCRHALFLSVPDQSGIQF